ncbi:Myb-like DNA-binding domain-containing protein [Spironucleus salmonicida]|uniref:Myb-like DNA-binding domain-containing protein n=1 Tax=Spironucleus salmonicida TaxID=348837 RepID=V6LIR4_9EUKA|nr:Myb-like DNA-binding domain-containing protein [Spironucleus salmonicida]|eukprot:EST44208.1 Myb-like DNA-binding domain-containing protein [Spironucleus salmonicida]
MTHRWTPYECQQVLNYVEANGMNWRDLQQTLFPELSESQVKQKYYDLSRKATGKYAKSQELKRFVVHDDVPKKTHHYCEDLMETLIRMLSID